MRTALTLLNLCLLALALSCAKPDKKIKLEDFPDYREALNQYNIGLNLINNGKTVEALPFLKKAVTMESDNFRYNHWYGFALMLVGDLQQAEQFLLTATRINPEHTDSFNNLATIYIEQGRFDEAQIHLERVIGDQAYTVPQLAYYNLGLCYLAQSKKAEALRAFEAATKHDKNFYRAHYAMGKIYAEEGRHEEALRYFLMAEKGYTDDAEVLYAIGKAYFQTQKYAEAQKYLAQVSILFPPPEIDEPTQKMLEIIGRHRK
jgi:Tfp pilus assembly protein PilF